MTTEGKRHMGSTDGERLTLPAILENLEALKIFIVQHAEKHGLAAMKVTEMELAADEILTNIISYAYANQIGSITVTCGLDPEGRFVAEIVDQGASFNPLEAEMPDVSAPLEQREIGGLGLLLVHKMVDLAEYERRGKENILRLYKQT